MNDHTPDEPVDILLVEDNPGDVRLMREAFRSVDSDVSFHVVRDGAEATSYLCAHDEESEPFPDLVLLDLNLPRVDGFGVLERFDEEFDFSPPPVLVLSSSETEEDIARSYENAANAYLAKPDVMSGFDSMANAIEEFWIDTAKHPPTPS